MILNTTTGKQQYQNQFVSASEKPSDFDDIHTVENKPRVQISLNDTQYSKSETVDISVSSSGRYPLRKIEVYLNGIYIDSVSQSPFTYSIDLSSIDDLSEENEVKIKGYDSVYNNNEEVKYFTLTSE